MHILYLDQNFCSPDGSGSTRSYEIARRWVQAGHAVTLVTSSASLPETYRESRFSQDGIDVNVVRVLKARRMGLLSSFLASAQFALGAMWRAVRLPGADVVFVTPTSISTFLPGYFASRTKAAPLVCEVRGPRPVLAGTAGIVRMSIGKAVSGLWDRMIYRAAHHIVALSPDVATSILAGGVKDHKITAISDGCDINLYRVAADHGDALLETYPHLKGGPLVVYAGALEPNTAVGYLVDVATSMLAIDPDIRFVICGEGSEKEEIRAKALHTGVFEQNLWMLPSLPKLRMPELLSAATVVMSVLRNQPGVHQTSPETLFEALAAGKPMALNYQGWHADLIESRAAGIALSPDNADLAARDLADFLRDSEALMRAAEQASALAESRFNRDKLTGELRAVLEVAAQDLPAPARLRQRSLALKRGSDVLFSAASLIILSPLLAGLSICVLVKMGQPIFFRQFRPGLGGRPFRVLKFRTMNDALDESGTLRPDGERITPLGRFLRRTSLDELPELINVLLGDMSLVGPRPLLMEYLPYYDQNQARRHTVPPGMTGWAQINGRNAMTWEEKFEHDVWYVENRSLWLDLKILLRTAWVVVTGKGVSAPGYDSMPRFDEIMARRQGAEDV
jgi:lipopolysaccharide/colanic/teichoic acid biosynthesis glycosyltransferase/glycosyltransferase involved in cell wall biosynthesis